MTSHPLLLQYSSGSKTTLIFTFLLMGIASFLIGILPTYASIGVWAPTALVTLRFLQGFALGGEVTGSQLMTMEHAPPQRRGFYGSLVAMGSPLAQVLANAMLFVIAASMSSGQFNRFGWRLPFLMSVVLIASRMLLIAMLGFLPLLMTGQPLLMGLAVVLLLCAVQLHAAVQPAWFAEQFPTEVRYIGSALDYTVPNILGSAAPIAATWLQAHVSGANWLNVATAVLLCLISMAAICASPETLARSAT